MAKPLLELKRERERANSAGPWGFTRWRGAADRDRRCAEGNGFRRSAVGCSSRSDVAPSSVVSWRPREEMSDNVERGGGTRGEARLCQLRPAVSSSPSVGKKERAGESCVR